MHYKKIIAINIFILFFAFTSKGQDYTIEWGKESMSKTAMLPNNVIGEKDGDIYLLKDKWSTEGTHHYISIEKYSGKDMHLSYSTELKMPDNEDGKETTFSTMYLLNGKLYLITQYGKEKVSVDRSKRGTVYSCYATPVSSAGVVGKVGTLIYQDEQFANLPDVKTCRFVPSEDKTKLFVYSGNITDSKLHGQIIDENLNITKDVDLELPFQNSFSISYFSFLDNHVYLIGKELLPESDWFSKDEKKYSYKVMDYDLKTKKERNLLLKGIDNPIVRIEMELQNKSILYVTGFYSSIKSEKTNTCGTFMFKVNPATLEQMGSFKTDISAEDLKKLNIDKSDASPAEHLYTKKVIELPAGGFILTSEHKPDYSTYANIYVQFISKNGSLEHSAVIPKKQQGMMPESYSFLQFYKNNKLYLVFNDSKKNLDLPDPYKLKAEMGNVNSAVPVIVEISAAGEWTKKLVYNSDKEDTNLYPLMSISSKTNQTTTFTQRGKKVKFVSFNH